MRKLGQKILSEIQKKLTKHFQWIKTGGKKGKRLELDEIDLSNIYDKTFVMENAFLTACLFSNINFEKADFYTAELYSCIFTNSQFENCNFRKAELDYCEFNNAVFQDCIFSRTDMYESHIRNSIIKGGILDLSLMKCDLRGSTLENIDFQYAYWDTVKVNGTKFINPQNLELAVKLSLDISTNESSIIIEGDKAIQWILSHNN